MVRTAAHVGHHRCGCIALRGVGVRGVRVFAQAATALRSRRGGSDGQRRKMPGGYRRTHRSGVAREPERHDGAAPETPLHAAASTAAGGAGGAASAPDPHATAGRSRGVNHGKGVSIGARQDQPGACYRVDKRAGKQTGRKSECLHQSAAAARPRPPPSAVKRPPSEGGLEPLSRELEKDYRARMAAMRARYDIAVSMLQKGEYLQAAREFEPNRPGGARMGTWMWRSDLTLPIKVSRMRRRNASTPRRLRKTAATSTPPLMRIAARTSWIRASK